MQTVVKFSYGDKEKETEVRIYGTPKLVEGITKVVREYIKANSEQVED